MDEPQTPNLPPDVDAALARAELREWLEDLPEAVVRAIVEREGGW